MFAETYTEPMARGPHTLRAALASHFALTVPGIIDVMRLQNHDLDEEHLPYPVDYNCYDPMHQTDYPVVGAYINSTESWSNVERLKSGSMVYDAAYDTTIFVVARTALLGQEPGGLPDWEQPERESAMKMRDSLHTAVRSALLGTPSIGTAGEEWRCVVQEETFRETFPDAMKSAQTNIYLCSGVMNLTIMVREAIASPIYGPLEGVDTTTGLIDDTP